MFENKEYFDFSNFSKDSKYYCADNKKILGKMKDEYGGTFIYVFASTVPRSYTITDENNCKKLFIKVIALILEVINLKM